MTGAGEEQRRRIDGVLFDYGETLVAFSRPDAALAEAEQRILTLLAGASRAASGQVATSTATTWPI